MVMRLASYYTVLGIDPDEKPAGLRAAYTDLVRFRPPLPPPRVGEAFEVLCDPALRHRYD
jgi:DnaJ-class molecular chaperone